MSVARRVINIAMSNVLCWFLVALTAQLASAGVAVSAEVTVAIVFFAVPTNSVINPFLYALNLTLERTRRAHDERMRKRLMSKVDKIFNDPPPPPHTHTHEQQTHSRKTNIQLCMYP